MVLDQYARLRAARDCISDMTDAAATPALIIDRLIRQHGASIKTSPSTNSLRVAGIVTNCTWSTDKGLIDGWCRLADRRMRDLDGRCE